MAKHAAKLICLDEVENRGACCKVHLQHSLGQDLGFYAASHTFAFPAVMEHR
jgi:hypothetical protein